MTSATCSTVNASSRAQQTDCKLEKAVLTPDKTRNRPQYGGSVINNSHARIETIRTSTSASEVHAITSAFTNAAINQISKPAVYASSVQHMLCRLLVFIIAFNQRFSLPRYSLAFLRYTRAHQFDTSQKLLGAVLISVYARSYGARQYKAAPSFFHTGR